MRKNPAITLLALVALILAGICIGPSDLVTSASFQDNEAYDEILFSIPVGDNGIHYSGDGKPDMLPGGPTALAIAPDGTFWIADTADNHLLHYATQGELIGAIEIGDFIIGAGDLEVTSEMIWILDITSVPSKVVQLSLDGNMLNSYNLPEGLQRKDGVTGISLGSDGSLLIELEGGLNVTRFISGSGNIELKVLHGYEFLGKAYSFQPGDLLSEEKASHGYVQVGEKRIDIAVTYALGSLGILHVNSDGSFFAEVQEMVINSAIQVDQKVYRYDASGNLTGMARVPLASQYIPVLHSIAISPKGDVFVLVTKPEGGEIRKLNFVDELPLILTPPITEGIDNENLTQADATVDCRSRKEMLDVASGYLHNWTYLSSYHINDPYGECPSRTIPPYLDGEKSYPSVPYAWGMSDSVIDYNLLMTTGGINHYFAGDITDPNSGCGRGVDCSGFVGNTWGLPYHHNTCDLEAESLTKELFSTNDLKPGDIMNKCTPAPGHVILFVVFGNQGNGQGMWGYEATNSFNEYKVAWTFHIFNDLLAYTPRRYRHVCEEIYMPLINKYIQTEMNADNQIINPYPPPDFESDSLPNPYP